MIPAPLRRPSATALACLAAMAAWSPHVRSQTAAADPPPGQQVVVTATRTEAAPFDVPASIDSISGDDIRNARAQINISDSLNGVPGLLARDRQNYAQDVQISVRGFGARASFGVRGVRLYVDGIPATLPDGQGQITNVELGSVGRIEVLRGPFSALYGNSAGGVIQVFTEEPRGPPTLSVSGGGGSNGTWRVGTRLSGTSGAFGYDASISQFKTDGYRDHSAAERKLGNLKLGYALDEDNRLTFIGNTVSLPKADDPLGLTRAQFNADPRSVDPVALSFDTRKTVAQNQAGIIYDHRIDSANALRAMVYDGQRRTEQFQAIPTATQGNPLNPGGVIQLARNYSGSDLRWTWKGAPAGQPLTAVAGLAYDSLDEHRRGYQNFIGSELGVQGALRRDETNTVWNFDQYVQATWQPAPHWTVDAGVRHSHVGFLSNDHYIVGTNPDDSGRTRFDALLPALAVMFAASEQVHLYATAGRGFETPTLNELAYRPGGATGLNFDLVPARSTSLEIGAKLRLGTLGEANAALYQTQTDHEIATLTNTGGRATFQNVGGTQRRGAELAWQANFLDDLRAQVAYTFLDATYQDAFQTCVGTPCSAPNTTIPAGNRIPGLARHSLYGSLAWAPSQGLRGGLEARYLSGVLVNDANTDAAGGYINVAANASYVARLGPWTASAFTRCDNLFDRRYAGSVIVNEGNQRYFEPAPGRTWFAGVTLARRF